MKQENNGETTPDENQLSSHEIKLKDSGGYHNTSTIHHKKLDNETMEILKLNGNESKNITNNITKLEIASNETTNRPGKIGSALLSGSSTNKTKNTTKIDNGMFTTVSSDNHDKNVKKNKTEGDSFAKNSTVKDHSPDKNSDTAEDNSLAKNKTEDYSRSTNSTNDKEDSFEKDSMKNHNKTQESDDSPVKDDHPRKRILAFGDSITKGTYKKDGKPGVHPYSKHLMELLKESKPDTKFEIFEEGVNGECACSAMIKRLPNELEYRKDIDLVIIIAGTNDLLKNDCVRQCDLFEAIKRLHEIVHRKKAKSIITTILESTFAPAKMTSQEYRDVLSEVNQNIRGYANQKSIMGKTMLCDIADEFPRKAPPLIDRIHPSPEGYDVLGEILFKCIKDFKY